MERVHAPDGRVRRHALALGASALAVGLALLVDPAVEPYVLAELLLGAVATSAWYGGLAAGLVATAVCSAASVYFVLPPLHGGATAALTSAVELAVFLLTALLVSRLRATVRASRAHAEASAHAAQMQELRLAFLAEASSVLGASLDYETTLKAVAHLAVPFLADYCTVDMLEDGGTIRRLAIEHVNPVQGRRAHELHERHPVASWPHHPVREVLRSGRPDLRAEVGEDVISTVAPDPEQVALVRALGIRSAMYVPLTARGRILGAIGFLITESDRIYDATDLTLAEDLARRCGTAIDNAGLFRGAQTEIAERKRAEARLRESEERLQFALDAARMGTWEWDLEKGDGEVRVEWAHGSGMLGDGEHSVWSTVGSFLERVHPNDQASVRRALERAIRDGTDYEVEFRVFRPDGAIGWIGSHGKVVRDASGKPIRMVGVPMDITERKRAEQRLAVQYETTRVLAASTTLEEAAPEVLRAVCECLGWVQGALWRVDGATGVLRCVDTWHARAAAVAEFEGASRSTTFLRGVGLPGRVWEGGEPVWIPDVARDTNFPRAGTAAQAGLHAAFGSPVKCAGEVLGVLEFFNPRIMPPDVELLAMIDTIGTQVGQFMERKRIEAERERLLAREQAARTEAEAAERRAAFLAEASTVLTRSLDHRATLDALARLTVPALADWCTVDLHRDDGTIERAAAAHIDPAKCERLAEFRPLRGGSSSTPGAPLPGLAPEDVAIMESVDTRSYMLLPLEAHGHVLGAMAFGSVTPARYRPADRALAEDLAHRAALAVENARLYRDAQEAARRKDEFLAMLGHELRNPLGGLRGAIEVLDHVGSDADVAVRQRAIIDRQTRHLTRLVDDLLKVSRVVSGRIALEREPVDLHDVVMRSVASFRPRVEERGLELGVRVDGTPPIVDADPVRLEQVLFNLLDNAVKYTPAGGRIDVTLSRAGDEAIVSVRDSGIGIAPAMLPRVFDLFTQAERTLDRAQGGLGLGLALVRRLIEQHGGTVAVASEGPDHGTEFTFRLPLAADVPAAAPAESPPPAPATERRQSGRHIVLIEDNADGREALQALLEILGHRVEAAPDGPRGVELALRTRPDVVLVDIGLPGLDGYQVAKMIRTRVGRGVVLVALTGYGQPEDRRRALEAGFDAHLVKPIDTEELSRLLAELHPADAA